MNEEPLAPLQSLQLIDSMINRARNRFYENGHMYLLWGWLILVCSITHFLLQYVFHVPYFYMVWLLTWVALIYQFIYLRKKRRTQTVVTYTDHIIRYIWLVFVIMMCLMVIVVAKHTGSPQSTNAVFLVLYGMPTFLSGIIIKFPALITGAICCWMLAILSLFIPVDFHILLIGAAVIAAWIIPGYLLRIRYRKMNG